MSGTISFMMLGVNQRLNIDFTRITCHHFHHAKQQLYLGMDSGDIYSFQMGPQQEKMVYSPKIYMTPGFAPVKYEAVALYTCKTPFAYLTDSSKECLVSIHSDGKVRLWDTVDGKCLLISNPHKLRNPSDIIYFGAINKEAERFLIIAERAGLCYILDIWTMKSHMIAAADRVPFQTVVYENHVVYGLDKDDKIKIYEFVGLQSKSFFEYEQYLTSSEEMNLIIKSHRQLKIQEAFLPLRQNDSKVTDELLAISRFSDPPSELFLFEDLLFVVYQRKLIVYSREENLKLGELRDFTGMKAKRSQYSYIVVEFDKTVPKICQTLQVSGSFLLFLSESSEFFLLNMRDFFQLFAKLSADESLNNANAYLQINKMYKPALQTFPGLGNQLRLSAIRIISHLAWDYFAILDKASNTITSFDIAIAEPCKPLFTLTKRGEVTLQADIPQNLSFRLNNRSVFAPSKVSPVACSLMNTFSRQFRRLFNDNTLQELLRDRVDEEDTVTAQMYGTLADDEVYLILGTAKGSVLLIKAFVYEDEDISIHIAVSLGSPIASVKLQASTLFLVAEDGQLLVLNFNTDINHKEVARAELKRGRALILREINSRAMQRTNTPGRIEGILPIIYLSSDQPISESLLPLYSNLIGLVLAQGQLTLMDLPSQTSVFEHKFSGCLPVGLYLDQFNEYLHVLFDNGDVDVFNLNVGNILMLIKMKAALLSKRLSPEEQRSQLFALKMFASECYRLERNMTVESNQLNLVELLKNYRQTYMDLRSFSKFSSNVLMNVTPVGAIVEYGTQFYHNPLISSHLEYQSLKKGAVRPRPLPSDSQESLSPKKKERKETNFFEENNNGLASIKDLTKLMEMQNNPPPEEKHEQIPIDQLPLRLQTILEYNPFTLLKERLGRTPLDLLDYLEENGRFSAEGKYSRLDLVRYLTELNYGNFDLFSDPESKETCVVLKKQVGPSKHYILNFYPPIYDAKTEHKKMFVTSIFFPKGVDLQAEVEIKSAFGDGFSTMELIPGVQGLGESFSFILNDKFLAVENNLQKLPSGKVQTQFKDAELVRLSPYMTTNLLLSIISELIYTLKRGYSKVQPLIYSIRSMFFERMEFLVPGYIQISYKVLSLMTLNDKLLVSAASHFILNNIYDKKKISSETEFMDQSILPSCSFFFLHTKNNYNYQESQVLSILQSISKFELLVMSHILFHLKLGGQENQTVPATRDQILTMIYPCIEMKISMSFPFLVIPVLKLCLETLPFIKVRDQQRLVKRLFHSVTYFSLYYGLTFNEKDQENPTYMNSSLLSEEQLHSSKQLKEFVANLNQQTYDIRRGIRVHILKLLKLLTELDLEFILYLLNEMMSSGDLTKLIAFNIVDTLKYIIKFCDADFNSYIIQWADTLMKSLNPNKPDIRKFCQTLATSAMKSLLKRYSFCSFHKDTQHFFIPNSVHEIIIYDLRTAMKWKSLKGHDSQIECLAVIENGNILASFSRKEKTVKFWKIGSTGFFENLLRNSTELAKSVKLTEEIPQGVEIKMRWLNNKCVELGCLQVGWKVTVSY